MGAAVKISPTHLRVKANVARARRGLMGWVKTTHPGYRAGWVHHRICHALERFSAAVARKEGPRLIFVLPPRHGKTVIVSQRWPVWHMVKHPGHEIVCASYGQRLANKSSRRARGIARSKLAGRAFGALGPKKRPIPKFAPTYEEDVDLLDQVEEWTIRNGSSYAAVGIGAGLTGAGAHCLIIDDYCKDRKSAGSELQRDDVWDWYTSTAYTRLAPGGGVLVMATRWHEDDLIGRLIDAQDTGGDQWEIIHLEAIATEDELVAEEDDDIAALFDGLPEDEAGRPCWRLAGEPLHPQRYTLKLLMQIKAAITQKHGLRDWEALYQGRPMPKTGGLFKREWFTQFFEGRPQDMIGQLDEIVISADLTFKKTGKGSFVCIQVWGRKGRAKFYLLHQYRERVNYVDSRREFIFICRMFPSARLKLVEEKANGAALIADLQSHIPGLVAINPEASKSERAQVGSVPAFQAGNVYLPMPEHCPWIFGYIDEHVIFPMGKDDQVDATSQFLLHATAGGEEDALDLLMNQFDFFEQ